ncbi:MAG: phosphate signaling complex protein PhoU [Candidatus Bathyarchaeota archaeon]|jgi:phosphate transport system protein
MSRLIDVGLEQLSKLLFKMGDLAEKTVSLSLDSYVKGLEAHEKVRIWSETLNVINEEVEDKAIELIARYQPVASDLRTIESYIKIAYDLTRYGRYAWDITFIYKKLNVDPSECSLPSLRINELYEKVKNIVHISIKVVKKNDLELSRKIGWIENEVDEIYYECLDKLVDERKSTTRCLITNLLFIRHLERIADHASYIGEAIIYLVTGERINLRGRMDSES